MRVAFTDFIFENRADIRLEGCDFTIHGPLRTADEIVAAAVNADVLCMRDQFGRVTKDMDISIATSAPENSTAYYTPGRVEHLDDRPRGCRAAVNGYLSIEHGEVGCG